MHHHLSAFHWDTDVGVYLFPGLKVNGSTALFLLSLVLILLSIAYEAIKVLQTRARARAARERIRTPSCAPSETANLITADSRRGGHHRIPFSKKFRKLFLQALVFMFHTTLGYIIMLSVMVYNGYVFLVVVLAMGLGYFLFGHISMRINMENMRARTTNVICSTACPEQPSTSSSKHTRTGYTNEIASDSSSDNNSCDNQSCSVDVPSECHSNTNIVDSCRL
ncbi:unnamed protein product [Hermetia illucens]|uniref:Copper transport protein n=1 Tax=Hermetia illucens TaxID=343691 RepID=A0A7R8UTP2_HERIL|nr:probable low affinity copper uptake protein 2 [Hermetia illucens]CAD7086874.1 unnamed protein product [Hermetia illucens]